MKKANGGSGRLLAIALLCICCVADEQPDGSVFVQGRIAATATGVTITNEADHSVLRIENPEIFRDPVGHRVVLHGTLTKSSIRAISAATIDDPQNPFNEALVQMAAYRKDVAMVVHLLQLGASPNAKSPEGSPALIEAIETGIMRWGAPPSLEITAILLDRGADPNATDKNWETPLMAAVFTTNEKVVTVLLDHKANVNAADKFGLTPLMDARGVPVVKLLLAAGASIREKDLDGRTALHHAAWQGDPDVVKTLIAAGADVNAKNNKKQSPLDLARERLGYAKNDADKTRFQTVIEILLASGAL
jgi:ankyrin repeat protein